MWTTPSATEMRFGFEVTMYVMNKQWYSYKTQIAISMGKNLGTGTGLICLSSKGRPKKPPFFIYVYTKNT